MQPSKRLESANPILREPSIRELCDQIKRDVFEIMERVNTSADDALGYMDCRAQMDATATDIFSLNHGEPQ